MTAFSVTALDLLLVVWKYACGRRDDEGDSRLGGSDCQAVATFAMLL